MQIIQTISSEDFKKEIENSDIILIDIRTPNEKITYGYIPNTKLFYDMYSQDIGKKITSLNKKEKYLIYCFHGNRSNYLLKFMAQNGFEYVKELDGGIASWTRKGFEVKY